MKGKSNYEVIKHWTHIFEMMPMERLKESVNTRAYDRTIRISLNYLTEFLTDKKSEIPEIFYWELDLYFKPLFNSCQ